MINKTVEKLMNEQIVHEFFSAYLYLSMAAYAESVGLKGAANWLRCQAQEEEIHAMKFFMHIIDRGGKVELGAIGKPQTTWPSLLAVYKAAYEHEVLVTGLIDKIVNAADEAKDHASKPLLNWFIDEQIEEEQQTDDVARKLTLAGSSAEAILGIDRELAARIFTYPTVLPGNLGAGPGPAA